MVFPVVHSCDRVSALVKLIEIAGFKKVLLFAEDRTAQLPVTIYQGGSIPQQVKREAIRACRWGESEIIGVDTDAPTHRGSKRGRS